MHELVRTADKVLEVYCFGSVLLPFLYVTLAEAVASLREAMSTLRSS